MARRRRPGKRTVLGQWWEARPVFVPQENTLMAVSAGNEGFEGGVRASFARQRVMETLGAVMTEWNRDRSRSCCPTGPI